MKRKALILFMILTMGSSLFAHMETRLAGQLAWEWDSGKDSLGDLKEEDIRLGGVQLEFVGHRLGFGVDSLVNFYTDHYDDWYLDWQGNIFLRYHLFGSDSFIDPFIEAGFGNAGSVNLDYPSEETLKLSLYPSLSTGLNLVFSEGLYMGGRFTYRPTDAVIPVTDFPKPALGRYQATFYVGMAFGHYCNRHHCHHHHYYD